MRKETGCNENNRLKDIKEMQNHKQILSSGFKQILMIIVGI